MDSINREQPEHNLEHLAGRRAVERIENAVEKAQSCFFCTRTASGGSGGVRPMGVLAVDDPGNLRVRSAADSHTPTRTSISTSRARRTPISCI